MHLGILFDFSANWQSLLYYHYMVLLVRYSTIVLVVSRRFKVVHWRVASASKPYVENAPVLVAYRHSASMYCICWQVDIIPRLHVTVQCKAKHIHLNIIAQVRGLCTFDPSRPCHFCPISCILHRNGQACMAGTRLQLIAYKYILHDRALKTSTAMCESLISIQQLGW